MSPKILLAALVVTAFSSCSTAYKSGQTPDDVYYSPVRVVQYEEDRTRDQVKNDQQQEDIEDRDIRMRIRNQRWRYFDDYSYTNTNYNHYCNCYCNNGGWGYYNHPYANPNPWYSPGYGYYPGIIKYNYAPPTPPRVVNLGGYNAGTVVKTYTDPKTGATVATPKYNNSNSNTKRGNGLGNAIREVFTPSSNSNTNRSNSNTNNDTRTYSPSSSSSSSSSSSGSSSGGSVSRPGKGN